MKLANLLSGHDTIECAYSGEKAGSADADGRTQTPPANADDQAETDRSVLPSLAYEAERGKAGICQTVSAILCERDSRDWQ